MASSPKKSAFRAPASVEPDFGVVASSVEGPTVEGPSPTVEGPSVEGPSVEGAVVAFAEPAAEVQQSVRTAVEKGVTESRAAFARAKSSMDDAANAFELSFAAAKDGVVAINAKALEALRANAEANLDFIKASFAVKTLSDLVALQSEFARKRVDAVSMQFKDLGALAQKAMVDSIEPVKEQVAKTFKMAV